MWIADRTASWAWRFIPICCGAPVTTTYMWRTPMTRILDRECSGAERSADTPTMRVPTHLTARRISSSTFQRVSIILGFRLIFGPDQKLYLSIGDQGNNRLRSPCPPNRAQELPSASAVLAQDWTGYQGKVLRMNLDGSIPTDNPVLAGVRSHIFSYGHRNPQGLVFGPTGILYESEHGPDTDDELNILEGGRNYGWPNVAGYNDDQAYTYAAWFASSPAPCASLHFSTTRIPPSVPQQRESAWHAADFAPPILTLFTVPAGYDPETQGRATVAPSGIDISATKDSAEGWATSLWITSLTRGRMHRVDLTADGRAVKGTFTEHFRSVNRYRDVAIDPSRHRVYIVTDATGSTRDVNGHETRALENPGAILEFFDREGTSWALSKVEAGGPGADKGGFVNSGTRLMFPSMRRPVVKPPVIFSPSNKLPPERAPH